MELSEYILQTLRKDGEFILYRGRHRRQDEGIPSSILVRTPFLERPALGSLRRMEHELSWKAELNPEWAVRSLALTEHQGRAMLLLEDPGGETSRSAPCRADGVGTGFAPGRRPLRSTARLHGRGLIHKEVKPANVLIDPSTGQLRLTGFGIASRLPRVHCQSLKIS